MYNNEFLGVKLNSSNIDIYVIRNAIFSALDKNLKNFSGRLLDVGCGKMPYREFILKNSHVSHYVGLDLETALNYDTEVKPDITWNGKVMPFDSYSFDCAFATEVLEHCSEPEVVLKEVFRILKPGGIFFFTVPFLWNLHEVPYDEYRYTPFSLKRHLINSGFTRIEMGATGGWHASMAQMLGMWIKRSQMSKNKRKFLSILSKPIIKYLIDKDNPEMVKFSEGQMITGLYGFVVK